MTLKTNPSTQCFPSENSPNSQKSFCILVYVDNTHNCIEEFLWLYKSWRHSKLEGESDIIAVCHPEAVSRLPVSSGIRLIISPPASVQHPHWLHYPYINSVINLCSEQVTQVCLEYPYCLKTDCDTFLTSNLRGFRPSRLCFGIGGYAYLPEVRQKLNDCFMRWVGHSHPGIYNVGATLMGASGLVQEYLQCQHDFAERLLREEFFHLKGKWPHWYHGVLTMYAGELALNALEPQNCTLGLFDHFCHGSRPIGSDVLHIHAWQSAEYWSKHDYRAGAYNTIQREAINRETTGGYCHWLASASMDEVLDKAESPRGNGCYPGAHA